METQQKVLANDLHWVHPVSTWQNNSVTVLSTGKGAYVTDANGHEFLDGFSGLWCVNLGYGQESIVQAATTQMRRLAYATGYFDFGSQPAIELARKLAAIGPGDLNHVLFTLGGSDAIDTVIRLIQYYFNSIGKPLKKQTISLERGYHGSSAAGSGVTAVAAFQRNFDVPQGVHHYIPSHYTYRNPAGSEPAAVIEASVQQLKQKVAEIGADRVAAFFCEPVQGAGGVLIPPPGWLAAMAKACDELGILLVVDEVVTGFGRTGPMFACDAESVSPAFMTVAKGLTSGYSPMGAVFISDRIHQQIAQLTPAGALIGHGLTYSGHPVSAAIALEALRLYQEGGYVANGEKVGAYLKIRLNELLDHPLIGDVRSRGMLAGVELVSDKLTKTKFAKEVGIAQSLFSLGYQNKLLFRAFADDIVGFAPPLCCTNSEVDVLVDRFRQTLDQVLQLKEVRTLVK